MLDAIGVDDAEPRARRDPRVDQAAARRGSPPREKRILLLRFFRNMTQSQIAEEIGVSQMHVSRLLNRTLDAAARPRSRSRELGRRRSATRRAVGERVDAGRVQQPGEHDHARPRPAPIATSVVGAAAEVPGQPELDQLGEHDGLAGPRAGRGSPTRRTPAAPRRTPAKKTAVVTPIDDPVGVEAGAARAPPAGRRSSALDGHQRGGDRRAAPGRRCGVGGRHGGQR